MKTIGQVQDAITADLIWQNGSAGQVAVRKKVGGGSFVCGLKRVLSPEDTLECHAAIGKPCPLLPSPSSNLRKSLLHHSAAEAMLLIT